MSGSMKESIKALNNTFSAPSVSYPLPDELVATIQAFLDKYASIDEHDSQRFHEDLHALYLRHVAGKPEKHGAFLSLLRILRPAITGEDRLTVWWDAVIKPTLDGSGYKRQQIEDAREFVSTILVYDADSVQSGALLSKIFTKKVLDAYLERLHANVSADHLISPDTDFVAQELETVLIAYGRKMPKDFITIVDELFVHKQHRIQALNLLSAFVRLQPPHLYLVLETSLVQHLEKCLLIDTSSTAIELALVVLIMLLPHICSALTTDHHLHKLFLIYTRVLCWDKLACAEKPESSEDDMQDPSDESEDDDEETTEVESAWEQLKQSAEYPDSSPPTLMHYYTFLYGLFPLNFMSFIRKPRKYLKAQGFPGARDFDLDQGLVQSRTEPYRKAHLLHPNMFTTTPEDELKDNKWSKSDPADVVTDCMDLCVAVSSTLRDPGPPPTAKLPPLPEITTQVALDDEGTTVHGSDASWRNTQSTVNAPSTDNADTPEVPITLAKSMSAKSLQSLASPLLKGIDMKDSPTLPPVPDVPKEEALSRTSTRQASMMKQPSLDNFAQKVAASDLHTADEFKTQTIASLQREIMLLKNDLNFERYLKLQQMAHIGQLQRKHIKEATADAETQNLINANKTLKARLAKADELYAQLKKETLTSRSQSKKWESDLSAKVRIYRENEKSWNSDGDSLRFELQRTQADYEHLKKIVERAEAQQLKAQQRTEALEYELEDFAKIKEELEVAQEKILAHDSDKKELHSLMQERSILRNDLEIANMRLSSREQDRERTIKAYERRIMELESRLQVAEAKAGKPGQLPSSVQQMPDSALASSNAKLQSLKKAHYALLEQHTELQMRYHDLEGEQQAELGQMRFREKQSHLDVGPSRITRSSSTRQPNTYVDGYLPPISTENRYGDRDSYYDYRSPDSISSPTSSASPARHTRLEPMTNQRPQRSATTPSPYPGFGGSFAGPDFSAAYDASLSNNFQAPKASGGAQSSGKSSFSVETDESAGRKEKDKVEPKSEVRVYGRGGAQNIGKKVKEKDLKKAAASSAKSGGFRGLRGIM